MSEIIVRTSSKDYSIRIQNGLLEQPGRYAARLISGRRVAVISDETVAELYLSPVLKSFYQAGFKTASFAMPAGEAHKNMQTLERVYEALYAAQLTRKDLVVALGGGVVGDLGGFAAATYQRGVRLLQIPTSLMAQVDSSVGGKTAIDMPFGKNMVGAFYQPQAVLIDPLALRTLPRERLADGMAEVIKYGCIKDAELFGKIEQQRADLEWMVDRSVRIKAAVVKQDEYDTGERMLLNFGHTLGHAIERATGYTQYTHGEAVAIGMLLACRLGEKLGVTPESVRPRLTRLLKQWRLPLHVPPVELSQILAAVGADKKHLGDKLNLILLTQIGEAVIRPLTQAEYEPLMAEVWTEALAETAADGRTAATAEACSGTGQ
ncbi:MAG: 3-dehydroquinate synthase [Oscillospiraceae bacterium]|nr:3-dehydroquinate synthase [Oscillospiraceae bacterium]